MCALTPFFCLLTPFLLFFVLKPDVVCRITSIVNGMQKIRAHRDRILAVAQRHGALRLRVFGSVARNEDRPESDVDFLVQMQEGADLLDMIDLSQELEELLHQKTDVISEEELSPYLKNRILQEAIAV